MELNFYENMTLYRRHHGEPPQTFVGFILFMAACITIGLVKYDGIVKKLTENEILRKVIKVFLVILSFLLLAASVVADRYFKQH